jgi:hypothetical protein
MITLWFRHAAMPPTTSTATSTRSTRAHRRRGQIRMLCLGLLDARVACQAGAPAIDAAPGGG